MGEVDTMLARYVKLKHKTPEPDEDPTIEQLSVFKEMLRGATSYVDFGLWGPHGQRSMRSTKFEWLVLPPDALLVRTPGFTTWSSCFVIYETAMIMLDQCHRRKLKHTANSSASSRPVRAKGAGRSSTKRKPG